jgi:hypothetical protein
MKFSLLNAAAMATVVVVAAACGGANPSSSDPSITLINPESPAAHVAVTGLSSDELAALSRDDLTAEQWPALLRVGVDAEAPPMLGSYAVADGVLKFIPAFPLDQGRQYHVRFDPSRVPGTDGANRRPVVVAMVSRPASTAVPSTVVSRVYPTGDHVPENLLRMYVEFSGPMSRPSGIPHMKLLDDSGREITGAFLPLDYEFWSPDHTRFTAFLDPGRVKSGILPNTQMGRALNPGRTVTLVISSEWRDQYGLPLKEEFRRQLRVGPPDEQPLDTASWRIEAPAAGRRDPLVVAFPEPLDHALLMRALGVTRDGTSVEGDAAVEAAETRWTFTPREPWRAGTYQFLALDILEDLAGNQIGRAFEVDNFDTVDKSPNPETVQVPFTVRPTGTR